VTERTYRVEWTEVARRDLEEIVDHVSKDRPVAALRLLDLIEEKASSLSSLPLRGRLPPELGRFEVRHYRELVIPPYRLIYRLLGDSVFILGVFDGRRNLEDLLLKRLLSF
jgi:addiction module RelE/StbE family toxin